MFNNLKGKNKKTNAFGNYFEFVNGEKSTKFVDIINRAKVNSPFEISPAPV